MMFPKMSKKVLLNFSDHLLSLISHNIFSNVFGLVKSLMSSPQPPPPATTHAYHPSLTINNPASHFIEKIGTLRQQLPPAICSILDLISFSCLLDI